MPKKPYREIVTFLEAHGFEYDRTNSKNVDYFTHPSMPEVGIQGWMSETDVRRLKVKLQRSFGELTAKDMSKRDAAAVKERRAGDRERARDEVARLEAVRAQIERERETAESRTFGDLADQCTPAQLAAIRRRMEENARELAYWRSLMTELPAPREQNVRHRA